MSIAIAIGGRLRRIAGGLYREVGAVYSEGVVAEVDLSSGRARTVLTWRDPEWDDAPDLSHVFKGGSWDGDQLLLCTERNLLWVDPGSWTVEAQWSHRAMNDVHHAVRLGGHLYVACAGLDAVLVRMANGQDVLCGALDPVEMPWTDRRTEDLAPSRAHPNHVFAWRGEVWVTRFQTRDAAPLRRPRSRHIPLGRNPVHDGLVVGDEVLFTGVDGRLLRYDGHGLITTRLALPDDRDEPAGWCRGLCVDDEGATWVGFTRLRHSRFREHVAWAGSGVGAIPFDVRRPTRIQRHDPATGAFLDSIVLEDTGLDALFALLLVP